MILSFIMNSLLFLKTSVYIFLYTSIDFSKIFNELLSLINAHIIISHQYYISKKQQNFFMKDINIVANLFIQITHLQFEFLEMY